MLQAWACGDLLGVQFSISVFFQLDFSSSFCSALVRYMKVGRKSKKPVSETETFSLDRQGTCCAQYISR